MSNFEICLHFMITSIHELTEDKEYYLGFTKIVFPTSLQQDWINYVNFVFDPKYRVVPPIKPEQDIGNTGKLIDFLSSNYKKV